MYMLRNRFHNYGRQTIIFAALLTIYFDESWTKHLLPSLQLEQTVQSVKSSSMFMVNKALLFY